jgi:hypothetical protein
MSCTYEQPFGPPGLTSGCHRAGGAFVVDCATMPTKYQYYAVAVGRTTGIFASWWEARDSVKGFPNNCSKGFRTRAEAEAWLATKTVTPAAPASVPEPAISVPATDSVPAPEPPVQINPVPPSQGRLAYFEDRVHDLEERVAMLEEYLPDRMWDIPARVEEAEVAVRQVERKVERLAELVEHI